MTDHYTATLEAQNEELKQLLAKSELALIELHKSTDAIVAEHKVMQPKWYNHRVNRRNHKTNLSYIKSVYVYTVWGISAHIGWVEEYNGSFASYVTAFNILDPPQPTTVMLHRSLDDAKHIIESSYKDKLSYLVQKSVLEPMPES